MADNQDADEGDDEGMANNGEDLETVVWQLRKDKEQLKLEVRKYQYNLMLLSNAITRGQGVQALRGKRGKMNSVEEGCQDAVQVLGVYIHRKVWPRVKFLRNGWEEFTRGDKSLCVRICLRVKGVLPKMWTLRAFWHVYGTEHVRRNIGERRNNGTGAMKKTFMGESLS